MTYLERVRACDDIQREAIQLFNELSRIRRLAKKVPSYERRPLEERAVEIGAELRVLLDKHKRATA